MPDEERLHREMVSGRGIELPLFFQLGIKTGRAWKIRNRIKLLWQIKAVQHPYC